MSGSHLSQKLLTHKLGVCFLKTVVDLESGAKSTLIGLVAFLAIELCQQYAACVVAREFTGELPRPTRVLGVITVAFFEGFEGFYIALNLTSFPAFSAGH